MLILYLSQCFYQDGYTIVRHVQYDKKFDTLQFLQLNYLMKIMEMPKPLLCLYLELGILPIKYEIEMRQILYLKKGKY